MAKCSSKSEAMGTRACFFKKNSCHSFPNCRLCFHIFLLSPLSVYWQQKLPFSGIFLKDYEAKQHQRAAEMNKSIGPNLAFNGLESSHGIILINTCNEIEGKYVAYLSTLSNKKVIPVGPLIHETPTTIENEENSKIIQWLDKKDESSCVYVSFGSEYFLSKEEIEEIAHSLELSELNFIWVLRFPLGEEINIEK
ncbi:putative MATH domain-containing protein-like [Capsicum annuum]|uniref:Uncharacterized protein n=1 Tax=Capsicum annuum TaxID=4072 RepID=A0A2G3ALJ7_CAPAN|nr:putative MATH domain-containing protein-like [Capsicum annuum]PHT95078.1 hypothetical protein T459_02960 [Capsicum annuum]